MSGLDFAILNYSQLREDLPQVHGELVDYFAAEESLVVRSFDDSLWVLDTLERIGPMAQEFVRKNPHFFNLFEQTWGAYRRFNDREHVYEICVVEKFLFPENSRCPLESNGQFDRGVLKAYEEEFSQWVAETQANHVASQECIRGQLSEDLSLQDFACKCTKCVGDFRSLFRQYLLNLAQADIARGVEQFKALSGTVERAQFILVFQGLSQQIDGRLAGAKLNLRRGTLHKLRLHIDVMVGEHFNYDSDTLVVYREKLDQLILNELQSQGLARDFIEASQRHRFFQQRGQGIWKNDGALIREIHRLIQTVLSLKRKDVSARILQDYLGQFWLHCEARKLQRKIIYHMGPTNSGKTYHAIQNLAQASRGCYLAPLRLLATELYDTLSDMGTKTTLLTGEEVIENEHATHYSSTIEMVKLHESFEMCVIDEIQMINDPQRGWAWTRALTGVQAPEVHICGDPTALELVQKICDLCGDQLEIKEYQRMTDLKILSHKVKADELQKHDAVIVFSRRNALRFKIDLERLGHKVSIVYGRLGPEVRREQARKFDQGETDIIVSTDAISMGMNLPIKRVIFSTLSKFIDSKEIPISNSEIKQIAGRAGRYKRYPVGFVSTLEGVEDGINKIQNAMDEKSPQKDFAMVGPDLDIFAKVNSALKDQSLPELGLSEFLRLFNTMQFDYPFCCVDLKEMIEITEMVEQANVREKSLSDAELFGFSCAPVNLGLPDHVKFFLSIVSRYVQQLPIKYKEINCKSDDIDYLEMSIKCLELYQWLARHFNNKNFAYDEMELLHNKGMAIEKLNSLLSERITLTCVVCGCKLPSRHEHIICDPCFKKRKFRRRRPGPGGQAALRGKSRGGEANRRPSRHSSGRSSHHPAGRSNNPPSKRSRR